MFSGPLNQCTSWTNRLWASLSAFSGTVELSVLPCRFKVEICETKQEFIQQEKQYKQYNKQTTIHGQHSKSEIENKISQALSLWS